MKAETLPYFWERVGVRKGLGAGLRWPAVDGVAGEAVGCRWGVRGRFQGRSADAHDAAAYGPARFAGPLGRARAALVELANRPDRVHGYWVNSADFFYYFGTSKDFKKETTR